jgi:hypothetical protein
LIDLLTPAQDRLDHRAKELHLSAQRTVSPVTARAEVRPASYRLVVRNIRDDYHLRCRQQRLRDTGMLNPVRRRRIGSAASGHQLQGRRCPRPALRYRRRTVINPDHALGEHFPNIAIGHVVRRYQRSAMVITSCGNRNAANTEPLTDSSASQFRLDQICARLAPDRITQQCRAGGDAAMVLPEPLP